MCRRALFLWPATATTHRTARGGFSLRIQSDVSYRRDGTYPRESWTQVEVKEILSTKSIASIVNRMTDTRSHDSTRGVTAPIV